MKTRILIAAALAAALLTAALPASALFSDQQETRPAVLDVVKGFCAVFCHNVAFHTGGGVRLTGFY